MDRFRQWGIFDAIAEVSSPSDYFEILTATGDPIMKEAWPEIDACGETKTHLIHRGDFIEALARRAARGHGAPRPQAGDASRTRATAPSLTFANGGTVTADLVVGADGIKSVVREQLFSDQRAGVRRRARLPRGDLRRRRPRAWSSTTTCACTSAGAPKVYLLPLRHRGQVSFDITALYPDGTWTPQVTKDDLLATVEGFDERIVSIARGLDMDTVNVRAVYDIDPVDTWHSDSVVLVGDAAHSMLHHQGQGANSAILDAGALADALREAGSVKEALAVLPGRPASR